MSIDAARLKDIFSGALAHTDAVDRAAYLDAACAGDPGLRSRVSGLLRASEDPDSFLDADGAGLPPDVAMPTATFGSGGSDGTVTFREAAEAVGTVVAGRYKLLQQIGEGGMGTVWMADQMEPVKRRVAVKLIRVEKGQSKTILSRFEAERRAIALMDHPHIARLLDAGTTEAGSPYFVMELVKGVPLTDFCDAHKVDIPGRLTLFTQICSAVQHAHQKGIIHRDLKPSNILVESHDGKPVPKVIDFGLAKATTGLQLSEHTLFTAFGSVMGTPLYMAPEQASFNAVDVDTRADIYALGVILYELLTGTTPLTRETVQKAALDEMLKLIREQDAPTPSSRLSTSGSALSVAANRQMEPAKLGRFVRGELDWIVLKALSKDRGRRYETANGFARDVERFLNHEPVTAGPPSTRYRLRKFVRRNRPQVIAAGLVLFALVAGVVGTSWGLVRAEERRREADMARVREQERADAEAQARQEAKSQAALSTAVRTFLLRDVLLQAHPLERTNAGANQSANPRLWEVLDQAAVPLEGDGLERAFPGHPAAQGEAVRTLGSVYLQLSRNDLAAALLERAGRMFEANLGSDHADTLNARRDLARAYLELGRLREAGDILGRVADRQTATLGPDHLDTLMTQHWRAVLVGKTQGPAAAAPLLRDVATRQDAVLGPDHVDPLCTWHALAIAYTAAGQREDGIALAERVLARREAVLGPNHPHTLYTMHDLAAWYRNNGQPGKAEPLLKALAAGEGRGFGPGVAFAYRALGRHADALPLYERAYEWARASTTASASLKIDTDNHYGVALLNVSRFADAESHLLNSYRDALTADGLPADWVGIYLNRLEDLYAAWGKSAEAAKWRAAWLNRAAQARQSMPADSLELAQQLETTSLRLLSAKAVADAEPLLRECLAIREQKQPDEWTTVKTQSMFGAALLALQKYAEAEPLLLKGYEGMKSREKTIPEQASTRIPEALDRLIEFYTATNKPDEVAKWRAERAKYPAVAPPPPLERK